MRIYVFLPSFAENSKAEMVKRVRGIRHEKVGILSFSLWLLERSRQKLYKITLSTFSIHLPSFVQIYTVFEEICLKTSSRLITISA